MEEGKNVLKRRINYRRRWRRRGKIRIVLEKEEEEEVRI